MLLINNKPLGWHALCHHYSATSNALIAYAAPQSEKLNLMPLQPPSNPPAKTTIASCHFPRPPGPLFSGYFRSFPVFSGLLHFFLVREPVAKLQNRRNNAQESQNDRSIPSLLSLLSLFATSSAIICRDTIIPKPHPLAPRVPPFPPSQLKTKN